MEYAFMDTDLPQGISYYRLRQVDTDGNTDYSIVRTLRNWNSALLCHPNPTSGTFTLEGVPEGMMPDVLDAVGRTVGLDVQRGSSGRMKIRLLSSTPGLYTVRLGEATTTKLVVVEQ